jgi:hypothetical protein
MAPYHSLVPILEEFGLSAERLYELLKTTHGFVAGGVVSAAFFGKTIDDTHNLDIWIRLPISSVETSEKYGPQDYSNLVKTLVSTFFTNNHQQPSEKDLFNMSLDEIITKYRGSYKKQVQSHDKYSNSDLSSIVHSVDTFTNPWTDRSIQVIYTLNKSISEVLSSFDLDVCQFWTDGSNNFRIYSYIVNSSTLMNLYQGNATILVNPDELSNYQLERLQNRVAKYKNRGYNCLLPNLSNLPPSESFWQDFIFTTDCYTSKDILRNNIYDLFVEYGCNFNGSEIDVNVKIISNHLYKQYEKNIKNGDIWEYTWRFTWDAENKLDNIFLRKMDLLNPF